MPAIEAEKVYLKAEAIYAFLTSENEALDQLIIFRSDVKKTTTDQSIYEAIGAIEDKSTIDYPRLVKLLEVTDVHSFAKSMGQPRKILTEERAVHIKQKAASMQGGIQDVE